MAKRTLLDRNDTDALYKSAIEYAIEVYAVYDVSAELGISGPFSFSALEQGQQQENEARKHLSENGQPVMGVLQFDLADYLEYALSECRYGIALTLAKDPCEDIVAASERYCEENKADYILDAVYVYQVTSIVNGEEENEEKTISYKDLMVSFHSTDVLGDVLLQGVIGQEYPAGTQTVTILDRSIEYYAFADVRESVIMAYVEKRGLPEYLKKYISDCQYTFDVSQLAE